MREQNSLRSTEYGARACTILLFHRVNPRHDPLWDPMDPRLFDKVLSHVTKKYNIVGLQELCLAPPKSQKPLMAITFDDGYRDYLDYALPILHKYRCPSSMYVVTDCVNKNMPTWTYVFDQIFFSTKKLHIPETDYGIECYMFHIFEWASNLERSRYGSRFKQHLKKIDNHKRNRIMEHLLRSFDDVEPPTGMMMTWEEIRGLHSESVEIGSHSVTHSPLATISDDAGLMCELRDSAELIQRETGQFPAAISYPVGSYNEGVKGAAKKAGYQFGLAVDQKRYRPERDDLYAIPRIELYNESFLKTMAKLYGLHGFAKRILGR